MNKRVENYLSKLVTKPVEKDTLSDTAVSWAMDLTSAFNTADFGVHVSMLAINTDQLALITATDRTTGLSYECRIKRKEVCTKRTRKLTAVVEAFNPGCVRNVIFSKNSAGSVAKIVGYAKTHVSELLEFKTYMDSNRNKRIEELKLPAWADVIVNPDVPPLCPLYQLVLRPNAADYPLNNLTLSQIELIVNHIKSIK